MAVGLFVQRLTNDGGHGRTALSRHDAELHDEFAWQGNGRSFHEIGSAPRAGWLTLAGEPSGCVGVAGVTHSDALRLRPLGPCLFLQGLTNDGCHGRAAFCGHDPKADYQLARQGNGCAFHDIRHVIMITPMMR
jgi:hypothetical protein